MKIHSPLVSRPTVHQAFPAGDCPFFEHISPVMKPMRHRFRPFGEPAQAFPPVDFPLSQLPPEFRLGNSRLPWTVSLSLAPAFQNPAVNAAGNTPSADHPKPRTSTPTSASLRRGRYRPKPRPESSRKDSDEAAHGCTNGGTRPTDAPAPGPNPPPIDQALA